MNQDTTQSPLTASIESNGESAPLSMWLVVFFAISVFASISYFNNHSGGTDVAGGVQPVVYSPFTSSNQLAIYPRAGGEDPEIANGRMLFKLNCSACHQDSGVGDPSKGCPPLDGSEWVTTAGPNRLIRIVLNGLAGPLEVKGAQWGTGVMTPFGTSLNDQQVANVLSYIRQGWGNKSKKFDLVTPEQVKAIRAKTATQEGNWKPADLLQIADSDSAAPAAK